jgi:hypothetical protein
MNTKFVSLLKEEEKITLETTKTAIEKTIRKHFPNSYISITGSSLGPNESIGVDFAIGKDKSEWSNGIIQNDPAWMTFWIHDAFDRKTGELIGTGLTLESSTAGGYRDWKRGIKEKCGWRDIKKPSPLSAIVKALDKYFGKLKEVADKANEI